MMKCNILIAFVALATIGCYSESSITEHEGGSVAQPSSVKPTRINNDQPKFAIQLDEDFCFKFGRGSGLNGLNSLSINSNGMVLAHEHSSSGIRRTSFSITPTELTAIIASVKSNQIIALDHEYHTEGVVDGTQWIFLAEQGKKLKSIYFNNNFPVAITSFAMELDSILDIESRELEWDATTSGSEVATQLWGSLKHRAE